MTPAPTEWDLQIEQAVRGALNLAGKSDRVAISFEYEADSLIWVTELIPTTPGAAAVRVFGDEPGELNLTIGRTWLEVWAVDDPLDWLAAVIDAVAAGDLREVGGRGVQSLTRLRMVTRRGVVTGGDLFVWPWVRRHYDAY
ncbi:hypothetical protein ACFUTX_05245 [Microbacterium sp. NPDC057407]|uniref:hypothetical protein n=1 Tax=Microbacterium sp. NPDC057407 TaxID=3346120 RepID=UPI00366A8F28